MACSNCGGDHADLRSPHTGERDLAPCVQSLRRRLEALEAAPPPESAGHPPRDETVPTPVPSASPDEQGRG